MAQSLSECLMSLLSAETSSLRLSKCLWFRLCKLCLCEFWSDSVMLYNQKNTTYTCLRCRVGHWTVPVLSEPARVPICKPLAIVSKVRRFVAIGLQIRTLPVGLTTTCLHVPSELRSRIRLALAVPLEEKEIAPAFVTTTPAGNGFVTSTADSLLIE